MTSLFSKMIPILMWAPLAANAAVFDSFECKIELVDGKSGQVAKQNVSLDTGRRSLSMSPSPDVRMEEGFARSMQEFVATDYSLSAGVSLSYIIATRTSSSGKLEAFQHTCLSAVNVSFCRKGNPHCFAMNESCGFQSMDPFKDPTGWTEIKVVDGTPIFDERTLSSLQGRIGGDDGNFAASYSIKCDYKGTVY